MKLSSQVFNIINNSANLIFANLTTLIQLLLLLGGVIVMGYASGNQEQLLLFSFLTTSVIVSILHQEASKYILRRPNSSSNNRQGNLDAPSAQLDQASAVDYDHFTNLPNRQSFEAVLKILDDDLLSRPVSVIMLDLDNFQLINHQFSYTIGNRLLQQVARILKKQSPGLLSIARFSGDRFALIVPCAHEQAKALADFIRTEIEERSDPAGTASFGIATNYGTTDMQTTMVTVEQALALAKAQGRNQVVVDKTFQEEISLSGHDQFLVNQEDQIHSEDMMTTLMKRAQLLKTAMREGAERDSLTGLYNRQYLDRVLEREFNKALELQREFSIAIIDIDDFESINNTFGFTTGDRILALLARVVTGSVRANDWIARYEGEKFFLVMSDTSEKAAMEIGNRVVNLVRKTNWTSYRGDKIQLTCTVGISRLEPTDSGVEDLINRAKKQVKLGKSLGKNQTH